MIKAVTFDLWNTLIHDKSYTEQRMDILGGVLEGLGVQRRREELLEAHNASTAYYSDVRMREYRHIPVEERLDITLRSLKVEISAEAKRLIVKEFADIFLVDPPLLKDGVRETLERLRPRCRMGIISDTGITPGSVIRRYFEEEGILRFFSSTIFSDELGYCKPHERGFREALRQLSARPDEAMHVGDLLRTDVAGAKTAGMKAVWLKVREGEKVEGVVPDYMITSLPLLLKVEGLDA